MCSCTFLPVNAELLHSEEQQTQHMQPCFKVGVAAALCPNIRKKKKRTGRKRRGTKESRNGREYNTEIFKVETQSSVCVSC